VEIALKHGYRHIDTASGYSNEREVGIGMKMSGVPREEIFLTTKLSTDDMDPRQLRKALDTSLSKLDTPYIDLCTICCDPCRLNGG
jgi:glycerol 2-dehydrogenase (NADP+)